MKKIISVLPDEVSTSKLHGYLLGAIGPRPIAFASTIDKNGNPNLAPFSFFNVFSAKPPILIFSPARRVRNNTTKHTLENVLATKEVVINMVNYDIVQQMSLASTEYAAGENEFEKAGLSMVKSDLVAPYRVGESPVQFECRVTKVEPLGDEGGAGNLVFSEVLKIHIDSAILNELGTIDQRKIDLVARMGGNWYSRVNEGMFEVHKPLSTLGIGIDQIPEPIRLSEVLTGNDLGMLGNIERMPSPQEVKEFVNSNTDLAQLIADGEKSIIHKMAQNYLQKREVLNAWKILLA